MLVIVQSDCQSAGGLWRDILRHFSAVAHVSVLQKCVWRCGLVCQLSIQVPELFSCELIRCEVMVQSARGAEVKRLMLCASSFFPLMHV